MLVSSRTRTQVSLVAHKNAGASRPPDKDMVIQKTGCVSESSNPSWSLHLEAVQVDGKTDLPHRLVDVPCGVWSSLV